MARGVREWFEVAVFMAMVPLLPVTLLVMYAIMEKLGF